MSILRFSVILPSIFFLVLAQLGLAEPVKIPVIDDGISIQKPGVFNQGCYYGENESISDHAPVIYNGFGTWNIAASISHFKVQTDPKKPAVFFFNHKFYTDDEGNLVNRAGAGVGFLGSSEVALLKSVNTPERMRNRIYGEGDPKVNMFRLKKQIDSVYPILMETIKDEPDPKIKSAKIAALKTSQGLAKKEIDNENENKYSEAIKMLAVLERSSAVTTNLYIDRMEMVAAKIKEMFKENPDLNYMALQEVADAGDKTLAGEDVRALVKEFYEPVDPWVEAIKRVLVAKDFTPKKLESILKDVPERIPGGTGNTEFLVKR